MACELLAAGPALQRVGTEYSMATRPRSTLASFSPKHVGPAGDTRSRGVSERKRQGMTNEIDETIMATQRDKPGQTISRSMDRSR